MTSISQRVAELTEELPAEKQSEVLDFVEFLRSRAAPAAAETVEAKRTRRLGFLRGTYEIADDFDAPLPTEVQRFFEGDDDGVLGKGG
jgi:hypothetical protein